MSVSPRPEPIAPDSAAPGLEPVRNPATTAVRSRRAMLAGALGALGGLVAGRLAAPDRAAAAAGDPLIIGSEANNAGTSDTQLLAKSDVISFKVYQQGAGTALMGYVTKTSGIGRGVYGRTDSPNGDGIQARNGAATPGTGAGLRVFGGQNDAIVATTDNASAVAISAYQPGSDAVSNGTAIEAQSDARSGLAIHATASGASAVGLWSTSPGWGVNGLASGADGIGVRGWATSTTGSTIGVAAMTSSSSGTALSALAGSSTGVAVGVNARSNSVDGYGIFSWASASTGTTYGIYAQVSSSSGYAVYSAGRCHVGGNLTVSGTKSFEVDHPLDPANRYLRHYCTEGAEALTLYSGTIELDATGRATVELPAWFDGLNEDVRYGLTPVGEAMPDLHVAEAVADGRFAIAGGAPNGRVSWCLTARRRGVETPVEIDKPGHERGTYVNPVLYGHGEDRSLRSKQLAHPPVAATASAERDRPPGA